MLFEMAPRSDLYKHTQEMLKTNGFAEEAWHSKDTFAAKDAEAEAWLKENEAKTLKSSKEMKLRESTQSSVVATHSNNKTAKKSPSLIELPETKDKEVNARRAAYKFFYSQEMRKLGYRRDSDTMSKEDKAKVEEAVIGKLASWNKSRKKAKKSSSTYNFNAIENDEEEKVGSIKKTPLEDTFNSRVRDLQHNRQSEDDDIADKNDFFDSFLFNRGIPMILTIQTRIVQKTVRRHPQLRQLGNSTTGTTTVRLTTGRKNHHQQQTNQISAANKMLLTVARPGRDSL